MFDNYYMQDRTTEYVTKNVNVTEKKAPTDESVRLLNEMTDKALKNIINKFSTSNNILQVTGATFNNYMKDCIELHCKMTLNGKDILFKVECNSWEAQTMDKSGGEQMLCMKLYEKVCNKLAQEIMQPFFRELSEKRFL